MRIRKTHAAWAVKLWVLATVFVWYFLEGWEHLPWVAMGAAFSLVWWLLPEEPEEPVEPLPFAHEYKDKAIPMRPKPEDPGSPPTRE
jgi:fatty acid desaturase